MVRRLLLVVSVVTVAVAGVALVLGVSGAGGGAPPVPTGEIVFTRTVKEHGRSDLYVVAADGSHLRLLVRNGADAAVSPVGGRIAFVREDAIWTMRRDGTAQRQLTKPLCGRGSRQEGGQLIPRRRGRLTVERCTSRAPSTRTIRTPATTYSGGCRSSRCAPTESACGSSRRQSRPRMVIAMTIPRPHRTGVSSRTPTRSGATTRFRRDPRGHREREAGADPRSLLVVRRGLRPRLVAGRQSPRLCRARPVGGRADGVRAQWELGGACRRLASAPCVRRVRERSGHSLAVRLAVRTGVVAGWPLARVRLRRLLAEPLHRRDPHRQE
jgi:hypothetical protein